jgi:hypothetical protein
LSDLADSGFDDTSSTPEQVFSAVNYLGKPKSQIVQIKVAAGHLGLFMGRDL